MKIPGFTQESLHAVSMLLYAEGQQNPLEGECGQAKKRKSMKQARTPAQQQADKARAQASSNKDVVPSAVRSEAAKKAAETRKRCKGASSAPPKPSKVV